MGKELRLDEFHQLYVRLKRGTPWFDYLLLGLLVWIEEWVMSYKTTVEVDKAVNGVELPPIPDYTTPIYRETPGKGSISVSEMRLTAPWYDDTGEHVEPLTGGSRRD